MAVDVPQSASAFVNPASGKVDNRLHTARVGYDAIGNVLSLGVQTFEYDAENRQKRSEWNGTEALYGYDGEGERVKKSVGVWRRPGLKPYLMHSGTRKRS